MSLSKDLSPQELEQENDKMDALIQLEKKKEIIAKLKAQYGKDWTRFIPGAKDGIKSGIDWSAIKFRV